MLPYLIKVRSAIKASLGAQIVKNLPQCRRPGFDPWVGSLDQEDPLEKEMGTHSGVLDWKASGTEEPGRL